MKELTAAIKRLASEELARANEKFPQFASSYEAMAVTLKKFDECQEELEYLEKSIKKLWECVKHEQDVSNELLKFESGSLLLACELVQLVAMSKKFMALKT